VLARPSNSSIVRIPCRARQNDFGERTRLTSGEIAG
jgi:hypothetical protein